MELSGDRLVEACADDGTDAGILTFAELEPLAGAGTPVKPAVYEGGRYQVDRRWDGEGEERAPVDVVVIDNVPSQANRLEEGLRRLREQLRLPEITLDLSSLEPLPAHLPRALSSFQFPHRQADAYLRDAIMDGQPFERTDLGKRLFGATREDAMALLEWFPQSLLYGFWQSHLGKRSQAKLARSWVSEIVGVGPATTETRVLGLKGDPLNLNVDEKIELPDPDDYTNWQLTEARRERGAGKGERLSEIGHGQVPFKRGQEAPAGISFDRVEQRSSLSLAGLRQIRIGNREENAAARAIVAAIGLVAHASAFGSAFHLRSGCDLRPVRGTWTWLGSDGDETIEALSTDSSKQLLLDCVQQGEALHLPVGRNWPEPLTLAPSKPLSDVIRKTWPAAD